MGGWSVGIGMMFYAIFPILLLLIKTLKTALVFLIISIIVSCAARSALHFQFVEIDPLAQFDWSYFSFSSNMCFFVMGVYAYLVSNLYKNNDKLFSLYVPMIAVVIIFGLMFFDLGSVLYNSYRLDIVLWGLGLTALCIWQAVIPSSFIANGFFEYMGERSFSIYYTPLLFFFQKNIWF